LRSKSASLREYGSSKLRMTVVEHVAHHLLAGQHEAERARGRHAEVVHGFTAQELAD
jgi:hypothetical protein